MQESPLVGRYEKNDFYIGISLELVQTPSIIRISR